MANPVILIDNDRLTTLDAYNADWWLFWVLWGHGNTQG